MRPALTDGEYESLAGLRHQLRVFLAFSERAAREAGLEPQQHQLMLAVRAAKEAPAIAWLAEHLVLRHHSVVELVDRLEKNELVTRDRSPADRRVARVKLTPKGRTVLERLSLAHREELGRRGPALIHTLQGVLER